MNATIPTPDCLKVIQCIASTRFDYGGTSRSVPSLCNALSTIGVDNHLLTTLPQSGIQNSNLPHDRGRVHLVREKSRVNDFVFGSPFYNELKKLFAQPHINQLIHDHAIWLSNNHAVAKYCRRHSIIRVVSPRGMLGSWALANSKWKKRIAWRLFQKRDLKSADGFHATSQQEADEIRALGFLQPIAVVPNGVELPNMLAPRASSKKQFLFLSRIHPKKGLENLIDGWSMSGVYHDGWTLKIVGPDEHGYRNKIESLISFLKMADSITLHNEVDDSTKWRMFHDADYSVLPSFNENFGIAIAESLAVGTPVIASTHTPWQALSTERMGWWVGNDAISIAQALRIAANTSFEERCAMGQRAEEWVRQQFSWQAVAQQLRDFYQSLCDAKSRA